MRSFLLTLTLKKSGLAVAAASALVAVAMPLAFGAPTAAPPSDGQGYVDSPARCTKPDTAVLFGATKTSRVAICMTAAGSYEYRGVRVSDGATLTAAAKQTSGNNFVVDNDGVKYTVTPTALSVTAGGNTFRTETWNDFHAIGSPASPATATSGTTAPTTKPGTSGTAAPTSAAATPGLATSGAPKPSATAAPSSAAPLPPPMAAEVGGGSSSG